MIQQKTDPGLPVNVQESLAESWSEVAWCRVGGTECSSACMGPVEGGQHYFHSLQHSFATGQIIEREHSPAHQQKIGLKIYFNL